MPPALSEIVAQMSGADGLNLIAVAEHAPSSLLLSQSSCLSLFISHFLPLSPPLLFLRFFFFPSLSSLEPCGSVVQAKRPGKGRTECSFWIKGKCQKGADCTFSHDGPQTQAAMTMCKFHVRGGCNKGESCCFSHNLKEWPCKFFHAGGGVPRGEGVQ